MPGAQWPVGSGSQRSEGGGLQFPERSMEVGVERARVAVVDRRLVDVSHYPARATHQRPEQR